MQTTATFCGVACRPRRAGWSPTRSAACRSARRSTSRSSRRRRARADHQKGPRVARSRTPSTTTAPTSTSSGSRRSTSTKADAQADERAAPRAAATIGKADLPHPRRRRRRKGKGSMGQKIHPTGSASPSRATGRRAGTRTARTSGRRSARTSGSAKYLKRKLVARVRSRCITIERPRRTRGSRSTARPGVVIGKKGEDIETLRADLRRMMGGTSASTSRRSASPRSTRSSSPSRSPSSSRSGSCSAAR